MKEVKTVANTKKRAAIYIRVSSDAQSEKDTAKSQRKDLPEFAATKDYDVVRTYVDDGISAKTTERSDLQRLLDDIKAGKIDVVVVRYVSRLTRECTWATLNEIFGTMEAKGVVFDSPKDGVVDPGDIMGKFMTLIHSWAAEKENKDKSECVTRGIKTAHEGGKIPLKCLGVKYDKESHKNVTVDSEYEILKEMVELLLAGSSLENVAAIFNEKGYPTKQFPSTKRKIAKLERDLKRTDLDDDERAKFTEKLHKAKNRLDNLKWLPNTLRMILFNDFYFDGIAKGKYGEVDTELRMFPKDVIIKARTMVKRRYRKREGVAYVDHLLFLFRNLARCEKCGWKISVQGQKSKTGKSYQYYWCKKCGKVAPADKVDKKTWLQYSKDFGNPNNLEWVILKDHFMPKSKWTSLEKELKIAKEALALIKTKKDRASELYFDGSWDKDTYKRKKNELDMAEERETANLNRIKLTLSKPDLMLEAAKVVAEKCAAPFKTIHLLEEYQKARRE